MNSEVTAGILGGLGPRTTSEFNLSVTDKYLQQNPAKRPRLLSLYVGMDTLLEEEFITKNERQDEYKPILIDGAQMLERAGSDFLVIPCNTVHIFIDELRREVDIPIVSIIEETQVKLIDQGVDSIGILATPATIQSRLYHDSLEKSGVKIINPNDNQVEALGKIINRLVQSQPLQSDQEQLLSIMHLLESQGAQAILLACTDLQLLVSDQPAVIDTMDVLADATVKKLLQS